MIVDPAVLPLLRDSEAEPTYFYVLSIGKLSISGWQIAALEALLVLLALALVALAVHVFTTSEPTDENRG